MSGPPLLGPLLGIGCAAGVSLILLLTLPHLHPRFRIWPTPTPWGWQSILFWSLFRTLNVATLLIVVIDWQPWGGLSLDRLAGIAVASVGGALYGLSCWALGRENLYCGRDGLVTGGVYRWTRNPQYATAIPAYLGLALASHALGALFLAALLCLTFALMALAEEPWLEAAYGEEYRAYSRRVSRFYNWQHGLSVLRSELSRISRVLKEARP